MTAPNKLIFNFSSETAPDNYIRKKAATPRRKRAEVLERPPIVVDDDRSPLFEPLTDNTPDQTEVSQHPRLPHSILYTHRLATDNFSRRRCQ